MNQFNTDQNKGLIWGLMERAGKFNQLPRNMDIKPIFEKHIQEIEVRGNINASLVELNKQFMSSFLGDISRFNSPDTIKKNPVTQFNNNLQERENSFKESMTQQLPPSIDFSDKEEGPISDIDNLLAKQMEKRKLDVPKIENQDSAAVQDWLNGSSNALPNIIAPPVSNSNEVTQNRNISIGETLDNSTIQNQVIDIDKKREPEKKVRWQDTTSSNNKPPLPSLPSIPTLTTDVKPQTNSDLKTLNEAVLKILKNQEYIINAIHDLQDRI